MKTDERSSLGSSSRTSPAELRAHWPALLTSIVVYTAHTSQVISLSVAADAVIDDFGTSIGAYSSLVGVLGLLVGLGVFFVGPLITRFGAPPLVVIALVGKGVCVAASTLAHSLLAFMVLLLPATILHALGEQPSHHVHMRGYFRRLLPSAIAGINIGYSLSGALTPALLAPLITSRGWRFAYWVLACLLLLAAGIAKVLMRRGPLDAIAEERNHTDGSLRQSLRPSAGHGMSVGEAVRHPRFYALMSLSFLTTFWEGVGVMHLTLLLQREAGLSLIEASTFYSVQYLCAIVGKQLFALLYPLLPRRLHFYFFPFLFSSCHLLINPPQAGGGFAIAKDPWLIGIFVIVYGLSFGYTHSLHLAQPAVLLGRANLAFFQTMYYGCNVLGSTCGMTIIGSICDLYGSYSPALLVSFGATILMYLIDLRVASIPEIE